MGHKTQSGRRFAMLCNLWKMRFFAVLRKCIFIEITEELCLLKVYGLMFFWASKHSSAKCCCKPAISGIYACCLSLVSVARAPSAKARSWHERSVNMRTIRAGCVFIFKHHMFCKPRQALWETRAKALPSLGTHGCSGPGTAESNGTNMRRKQTPTWSGTCKANINTFLSPASTEKIDFMWYAAPSTSSVRGMLLYSNFWD